MNGHRRTSSQPHQSESIDPSALLERRYQRFISEAQAERDRRAHGTQEALRSELDQIRGLLHQAQHELNECRHQAHCLSLDLHRIRSSKIYRLALLTRRICVKVVPRRRSNPTAPSTTAPTTDNRRFPVDEPERTRPLVSIIMPVFNKGTTIVDSIRSVQAQTLVSWELIIWDDGSTDEQTLAVLDALNEPGIRVFRAPNQGVVAARNAAIAASRGHYVCCLDPDDVIVATYLEKAVFVLESNPDVAITYPWTRSFGDRDEIWSVPDLHANLIAQQNQVPICALMRRGVLEATGGFNSHMHDGFEDWELWAHAAELGFIGRSIHECLFQYRYQATSGRDADARVKHDSIRQRIMQLHPRLGASPVPQRIDDWDADFEKCLYEHPWLFPHGVGRPVIFFVPWLTLGSGAEVFLRELAQEFTADGRTVVVVATHPRPGHMVDGQEELHAITPYVYNLPTILAQEHWLALCRSLMWRLHEPVLVNMGSTWLYDNIEVVRSSGRGRVHTVDVLFNHIGHMSSAVSLSDKLNAIVVAHTSLERLLTEHFSVPSEVRTIPVGIRTSEKIRTWPTSRKRPVIGWLGRLSSEKRPMWFVELARVLGHAADFRMAGTGPLLESVKTAAQDIDSLEIHGHVSDAVDFLDDCDLLLCTSEIEGISLVAMEALSRGVPVMSTDVGGMRDLIQDGVNGRIVDAHSLLSSITALRGLLADDAVELKGLKKTVEDERLDTSYTVTAMAQHYKELFEALGKH